ncbi:IQ domain-containing protein H-like [Saccoglossus kowalevskii]|uniref:IQ domain-containing protein H-like n=1 Tax=Saccoglossus kowalevskii TaxID=10224 RepID=A0ABM0GIB0_SACKO|nr:PREDICTED: IQ domain-containing protein H-like [Saccoglossus kowalevskii]
MMYAGMEIDRRHEDVGEILVKVQEDLQQLKEHLIQKSLSEGAREILDIRALENAIQRTQEGVQGQTENVLHSANNQVMTLPALDLAGQRHPGHLGTQEALYDLQTGQKLEKSYSRRHTLGLAERDFDKKPVPRLTKMEPLQNMQGPSPGQQSKYAWNMRAIHDPTNQYNRQVLSDTYGVSLPLIVDKRKHKTPQKVIMGNTVEHLAVLPRANRVDPSIIPPAITEKDAKKGILSLLERGLIPPAAELTLDPSPVRHKMVELRDPIEKKEPKVPVAGVGDGNFNFVKMDLLYNKSTDSMSMSSRSKSAGKASEREVDSTWGHGPSHSRMVSSAKSSKSMVPIKPLDGALQPLPPPTTPASEFKHLSHRFPIQHGKIREQSQDFMAFKQHYCLSWGSIVTMLQYMERMLQNYAIPLAFINGDKLADLSLEFELEKQPTIKDLLSVIINIDDVLAIIKRPGRRFLGPDGEHVAATKIQATWRRYKDRMAYLEYRRKKWAAGVIAISWIMNVKLSKIRKQLRTTRQMYLDEFRERAKKFKTNWSRIQQSRRVLIHLPSLGYSQKIRDTVKDMNIRQNLQMARICDISDPNVEVIYICPVEVNDETLQYYSKLLGLRSAVSSGNVEDQSDVTDRYKIIVPEASNRFPSHSMCLATHLKYSPKALNRIKNLIKGREAYLVPGVMHKDDLAVAHELDIPVLGSEPDVAQLYSTKSGCKRVFNSAKIEVPPSEYDVYSLPQLHECLAQLVTENLDVKRWLFKLDDEFDGRGIAYCDVTTHLRAYTWAKKEEQRYGEKWSKKWAQEAAFIRIHAEIPDVLEKNARPVNTTVFPTWQKFLEAFLSKGGIIEACPPSESVTALSVDVLIEPTGKINVISCGDQIHAETPFTAWGISIPQSSVEPTVLNDACMKIAKACHQRGVIGHFTVDFLTFIDAKTMDQKLWAIDLNLSYNDTMAMTGLMLYVTGGKLDTKNSVFEVPPPKKEKKTKRRSRWEPEEPDVPPNINRFAVMSTRLLHTNLAVVHYSVFFQMCRAHGIGFDIKEKQGTVFTLIDSFKREGIGMLTIGEELQGSLATFARNLSVIHQEISAPNMQGQTNFKAAIEDIEGILGTTIQNVDRAKQEAEEAAMERDKQLAEKLASVTSS